MDTTEEQAVVDLTCYKPVRSSTGGAKDKSGVFFHYKHKDGKYCCNYCGKTQELNKVCSTSNLWRHIRIMHAATINKAVGDSSSSQSVHTSFQKVYTQEEFEKRLTEFVILTDQAFTIVEEDALKSLLEICKPSVKLVSASTIKRQIEHMYQERLADMIKYFQNFEGKVSFILDCWTSTTQQPFHGVVACWVSKDWEINYKVLNLDFLTRHNTDKNLAKSFVKILAKFNLESKILACTTDNGNDCDAFFVHLEELIKEQGLQFNQKDQRVHCLAHTVNLACQEALSILRRGSEPEYEDDISCNDGDSDLLEELDSGDEYENHSGLTCLHVLTKIRNGVRAILKSKLRHECFKKQCDVSAVKQKELILDVKTGWHSTYLMIKRAYAVRVPLQNTLMNFLALDQFYIREDEWESILEMLEFLKPFKKVTDFISNEQVPSMSLSVMIYVELYKHLQRFSNDETYLGEAAAKAIEILNKYYENSDSSVFVIGTILDPRCKLTWYSCNDEYFPPSLVKRHKQMIQSCWETQYKSNATNSGVEFKEDQGQSKKRKPEDLFAVQMKKAKSDRIRDELQLYLDEKAIPSDADCMKKGVLNWWKEHQTLYPNLSKMACDYLSISGFGVPVKHLFSVGSNLLSNPYQQKMKAEMIKKCMCLKSWLKFKAVSEMEAFVADGIKNKMLGNLS